jgi:hypothetical protein
MLWPRQLTIKISKFKKVFKKSQQNRARKSLQSDHSQHVIKRPMILPAPIDPVRPALVANAGGEALATAQILVRGRGVNHVDAVNHHVTGFAIGDEPVPVETLGEL